MSALQQCAVSAASSRLILQTRPMSASSPLPRAHGKQALLRSSCKLLITDIGGHRGAKDRVPLVAAALPNSKEEAAKSKKAGSGKVTKPAAAKRSRVFQIIGWLTYVPGIYIVVSYLWRYYQRHF